MKVSVIIPVYNSEKYLNNTIDSVINQDFKNLEIIIIDDYSSDNSKKIIEDYKSIDDRIKTIYQKKNKGVSEARNEGIKASTGDYIIFVDSDDMLKKSAIKEMVDASIKYNSDFIDSFHLLYFSRNGKKNKYFTEKKLPNEIQVLGSINDNNSILDKYTYVTGKLIKKELLKQLLFDSSLSRYEDFLFDLTIKTKIKNYVFLNDCYYYYYQREESLMSTYGEKHLCYLDAAIKVKEVYKKYDDSIKEKLDGMIFQNFSFTLFTKVIKNDKSLDYNTKLIKEYLYKLKEIIPDYESNKYINKMIIKRFNEYISNDKKLRRAIKKLRKKDYIKLYFKFMSIFYKYKGKVD